MNGLTDDEINRLKNARSAAEWNKVCDDVKRARGGTYPGDWWERVMASGLAARVQARF